MPRFSRLHGTGAQLFRCRREVEMTEACLLLRRGGGVRRRRGRLGLGGRSRTNAFGGNDAGTFQDGIELAGHQLSEHISLAGTGRPANLHAIYLGCCAEANLHVPRQRQELREAINESHLAHPSLEAGAASCPEFPPLPQWYRSRRRRYSPASPLCQWASGSPRNRSSWRHRGQNADGGRFARDNFRRLEPR